MFLVNTDVPDLSGLFRMCIDWVLYPWQNWSFGLAGLISMPLWWYAVGCFLLGMSIHFICWLADNPKAKFMIFGRLFGGK